MKIVCREDVERRSFGVAFVVTTLVLRRGGDGPLLLFLVGVVLLFDYMASAGKQAGT